MIQRTVECHAKLCAQRQHRAERGRLYTWNSAQPLQQRQIGGGDYICLIFGLMFN